MRMFAQQIGISSGRLSELMSGKRRMTARMAHQISVKLLLTSSERNGLLNSVGKIQTSVDQYEPLSADAFYSLADWQHFAILNLMDTDDFQSSFEWVAERLAISESQARESVQRLARLNLIVIQGNRWLKRNTNLTTTHDIESLALRISHRQSLEKVLTALDDVPLHLRDITSITMAVDLKRLPEAKEMIKKFRRELCAFLESGDAKEEVYDFNLQLIPVTSIGKKTKKEKVS